MGFLAPWFLLLGGAALVPLLIHLLRRRIGLQVEFPAARYLARAERDHSRTLRMRNLLLMLLRVAAVLLLAMAAARPTSPLAGSGHAPTALAIVLDNSMSTALVQGGAPVLDSLKSYARTALGEATPDDRLWLITADGETRAGSATSLNDELERVRSLAGAGNLREAVARGVGAVEASGLQARQVAILTDGQRTAWRNNAARYAVHLVVLSPQRPAPPNRAVVLAEPRPVRWTPRGQLASRTIGADSTTYRIALGERTLARGTIASGEEAIVRAAPAERGWTAGLVEIEPDELASDNVRHFALWIGTAPAVAVSAGAGTFVNEAVDVLRASERVTAGSAIQVASADELTGLPALILPPTDPVRIGAANRALERLGVPWRFGSVTRENAIVRGDALAGVTVAQRYSLQPRGVPDADTLALVGGDAWIVAGPRYVLVGSPLMPALTSLPISASFLPWLGDVLASRLHAEPGVVRYVVPGGRVVRPTGADALESAGGGRMALSGESFDAPGATGTYFFNQGTRRVGALVVNAEVDESLLDRLSPDELARRVATSDVSIARTRAEWLDVVFTGAARRSLVVPLLVALVLVLGAETVAVSTAARSRS